MKYLLVGDVHAKLDNLDESKRLIEWIAELAVVNKATPIFMGDQFDNMSIIRSEVLEFWVCSYYYLNNRISGESNKISTISITGNHDLSADAKSSALSAFELLTTVVTSDALTMLEHNTAAVGFIRDNQKFKEMAELAEKNDVKVLLCHAEFNGAQFENGFYSPSGIELSTLPSNITYISGHIHKKQSFGKHSEGGCLIQYIGTPRQLTRSDVNEIKGITLYDSIRGIAQFYPTPSHVSEMMREVTITEDMDFDTKTLTPRTFINIKGSKEFIKKVCKNLPDDLKIRTFPDGEVKVSEIKESEGIPTAFAKYSKSFLANLSLSKKEEDDLLELVYRNCPLLKNGIS